MITIVGDIAGQSMLLVGHESNTQDWPVVARAKQLGLTDCFEPQPFNDATFPLPGKAVSALGPPTYTTTATSMMLLSPYLAKQ